jgi:hypothetical protein
MPETKIHGKLAIESGHPAIRLVIDISITDAIDWSRDPTLLQANLIDPIRAELIKQSELRIS